jgi:AcrR family transcriptional regulator
MSERPPLRERNRRRTAAEIEGAAFELFRGRGYEATTVEQIAAAAGVSTRTFFRYFPSKEDVVFGDHAATVARLRAALADGPAAEPPLRRVRRVVLATQNPSGDPEREIARARLIAEVPTVRARFLHLVEDFEDAVVDAVVDALGPAEDARARAIIVAAAVFGALRGARRAAGSLANPDPERLVEAAFDLVEHGAGRLLATPEA